MRYTVCAVNVAHGRTNHVRHLPTRHYAKACHGQRRLAARISARGDRRRSLLGRRHLFEYASRSREHLDDHRKMQNLRRAIRILMEHIPERDRKTKEVKRLTDLSCGTLSGDDHTKDIDFTQTTISARWEAGLRDVKRALHHKSWLKPLPPHIGMAVHELPQE